MTTTPDPEAALLDRPEPIDPEVQAFVDAVQAGYRAFGDLDALDPPARRLAAEQVRAPWRAGGPEMARREDHRLPTAVGEVRVRLLAPRATPGLPALVYVHGGGFVSFSLDTHDRLMREYAARAGIAVIGVDYSLSPEVKFPVALHEIVAAVDWLAAEGGTLGIDPARLAIGGDSAGANLSVATCLTLRDRGDRSPIRAMLLNYGFFDRDFTTPSQLRHGDPDRMLTRDELAGFLDAYLGGTPYADDPRALPILADLHDLPPSFHAIAECDPLADGDRAMVSKLRAAGNDATSIDYRGATHSFLEAVSISRLADRAFDDAAAWLRERLHIAGDAMGLAAQA